MKTITNTFYFLKNGVVYEVRKVIEELVFSDVSSYEIYVNTGVNQGIIGDIKDGYLTIDSIPYIDAERLYYYGLERKTLVTN